MTKSKIAKKPSKHVRKRKIARTRQAVEKLDASLENVLVLMQVELASQLEMITGMDLGKGK